MEYKDQLNRVMHLQTTPKRIVSLVPSLTELLCDLGLETSIVGITKFCVHPNHLLKTKSIVGGTKQIHLDRIKELQPDIILCNKEENTKEITETCEVISTVHISDIYTIDDTIQLIEMYGELFSIEEKALEISNQIKIEHEKFQAWIENRPSLKVVYFIWKNPWMIAGNKTFIDYMLGLNNFKNAFKDKIRYPEITLDANYNDVECVILSSEPYPFKKEHFKTLQPVFPNAKMILVDGEMFSWYGSRLTKAFNYFKKLHLDVLH